MYKCGRATAISKPSFIGVGRRPRALLWARRFAERALHNVAIAKKAHPNRHSIAPAQGIWPRQSFWASTAELTRHQSQLPRTALRQSQVMGHHNHRAAVHLGQFQQQAKNTIGRVLV